MNQPTTTPTGQAVPSPVQTKVLAAVQNGAYTTRAAVEQLRAAPLIQHRERFEDLQTRARAHAELTIIAEAGGIPRAWIDQARELGSHGTRWKAATVWHRAPTVDREALMKALATDVRKLASWTVLHAARADTVQAATFLMATRNLRAVWARTCAVATLLEIPREQSQQRWAGAVHAAQHALTHDTTGKAASSRAWRAIAGIDTSRYQLQTRALTEAGIDIDHALGPPHPETMLAAIRADSSVLVETASSREDQPGAQISAAVDATACSSAGSGHEPVTDQPLPSDRARYSPGIEL